MCVAATSAWAAGRYSALADDLSGRSVPFDFIIIGPRLNFHSIAILLSLASLDDHQSEITPKKIIGR